MPCAIVRDLGKRPVLWADMVLKHPEALDELPRDIIFIDWNYGWALDRFGSDPRILIEHGFEVWGSPALRSNPDNYFLLGRDRKIQQRFSELNRHLLYPAELAEEQSYRTARVWSLYHRLAGTRMHQDSPDIATPHHVP
jgi:hypothetical protein